MSRVPEFVGCIASDEFPTLIKRIKPCHKFGFISNTDTSNQPGSHWVAIAINPTDKKPDPWSIMYFDPFGDDIRENMLDGLKELVDKAAPDKMLKLKVNQVQHEK